MRTLINATSDTSGNVWAGGKGLSLVRLACIICLFAPSALWSQSFQFNAEADIRTTISSEENPFWFYRNTNFEIGEETSVGTRVQLSGVYTLSENASLTIVAEGLYRDAVADEFQRGDLFVAFKNRWLKATLGARQRDANLNGLSVSNQNILWSGNARPVPGLVIEANEPIKITRHLMVDWGIGHYELNDDRFVMDTRIHYKRFGVIAKFNERNTLQFRIQHFAQWAGTSPIFGKLKSDFEGFIDVFTARKSAETGTDDELLNAVGNHLGSYFIEYTLDDEDFQFKAYHDHLFEDGSGTRLKNFPDGIWGVSFTRPQSRILQSVVYEFVTTKDQSGNTGLSSRDNYFRNSVYINGWSYEGNILGLPLIVYDRSIQVDQDNSPITGNRISAHHFGMKGSVGAVDWMAKTSYVQNFGLYRAPIDPPLKSWYNYLRCSYDTQQYGSIYAMLGLDVSKQSSPVYGVGVGYKYSL